MGRRGRVLLPVRAGCATRATRTRPGPPVRPKGGKGSDGLARSGGRARATLAVVLMAGGALDVRAGGRRGPGAAPRPLDGWCGRRQRSGPRPDGHRSAVGNPSARESPPRSPSDPPGPRAPPRTGSPRARSACGPSSPRRRPAPRIGCHRVGRRPCRRPRHPLRAARRRAAHPRPAPASARRPAGRDRNRRRCPDPCRRTSGPPTPGPRPEPGHRATPPPAGAVPFSRSLNLPI